MEIKQYQIILVNLDPTIGNEIKKTRPCVVISPNEMNRYLQTIVIAPMTTTSKNYPTRIEIKHDNKIGWVVLDKIRTIDKQRIIKVFGLMSRSEIKEVKAILRLCSFTATTWVQVPLRVYPMKIVNFFILGISNDDLVLKYMCL